MLAPLPPYSLAQCGATHPPAYIFLCHSSRRSHSSPSSPDMNSIVKSDLRCVLGRFSLSHFLNSVRNASSSLLKVKSMRRPLTPVRQIRGRPVRRCALLTYFSKSLAHDDVELQNARDTTRAAVRWPHTPL